MESKAGPAVSTARLLGGCVVVAVVLLAGSWSILSAGEEQLGFPDFTLEVTPATVQLCAPSDAIYQVAVGSLQGYSDPVTMGASGNPARTFASFSVNPVNPPGGSQLTIGNTGGAAAGLYQIDVVGIAPTSTHTATVFLDVYQAAPGAVTLMSPANQAVDQLRAPRMEWAPVSSAVSYDLEISTNSGFSNIVYSATTGSTVHTPVFALDAMTQYFWRARASNSCGDGSFSATRSFTTGTGGGVLLVDDDDDSPDVRDAYAMALDGLGIPFDVYDTRNSDEEPSQALLELYGAVVWFSGDVFSSPAGIGVAGPGFSGEIELAGYLDGGGCLVMSSQDYLWDHGLTPFGSSYLGIDSYTSDVTQTTVTGEGSVFGGLGPYVLAFPFSNYSDEVVPGAGAELAFVGDAADAAVTRAGSSYRTVFLGFPLEALPTIQDREAVLAAAFEACSAVFSDGFESGDVYRWSTWVP